MAVVYGGVVGWAYRRDYDDDDDDDVELNVLGCRVDIIIRVKL